MVVNQLFEFLQTGLWPQFFQKLITFFQSLKDINICFGSLYTSDYFIKWNFLTVELFKLLF